MSSASDTIKVAYKVLFSLQVEFEGYTDDVNPFVKIIPDASTEELLTQYKMLLRKGHGSTVLLIETEPEAPDIGKPEIVLANNERFWFQVKLDQAFLNGTHLASYNFTDHVLYASNSANNVVTGDVLISVPLQVYNASGTYQPGYLVRSGGKYYRALQASNSGSPHGVGQAAYWKQIDGPTYVSQADLRTRVSIGRPLDNDTIMVIEVVHSPTLAADYKLLDTSSKCREVIYKIRLHT